MMEKSIKSNWHSGSLGDQKEEDGIETQEKSDKVVKISVDSSSSRE